MRNQYSAAAFVCLLLLLFRSTAFAQLCPDHAYNVYLGVGNIGAGDINRDGAPDVIVGSLFGIPVLRGDATGNGSLAYFTNYLNFGITTSLTLGDFNRDGIVDVVTGDGPSAVIFVGLGTPAGAISGPFVYPSTYTVDGIAAADFNHDGNLDVVVINKSQSAATIIPGTATGAFLSPTSYSVGILQSPAAVAVADFNLDGKVDVVTANAFGISYLPGTAGGALGSPQFPGGASANTGIAVGDFNHDGFPDAVVSTSASNFVTIYGGNASGIGYLSSANAGLPSSGVVVADLNQDGRDDFAATGSAGNLLSWAAGGGNATFGPPVILPVNGTSPVGGTAADINRDGRVDILTGNAASGSVSVFFGCVRKNNQIEYSTAATFPLSAIPGAVAAADFKQDGATDAFIGLSSGIGALYTNNGSGGFSFFNGTTLGNSTRQLVAGDFNNDGSTDVAAAMSNSGPGLAVAYVISTGYFTIQQNIGSNFGSTIAAADFNLDGNLDIAVTDAGTGNIYICSPGATFITIVNTLAGTNNSNLIAADVNGDGRMDLVSDEFTANGIRVRLSSGGYNFAAPLSFGNGGLTLDIAAADYNRNGTLDVATADQGSPGNVLFFSGNGNGSLAAPVPSQTPYAGLSGVHAADLNMDGKPDVVALQSIFPCVIMLGNGLGTFVYSTLLTSNYALDSFTTADFDRNGMLDFGFTAGSPFGPLTIALASVTGNYADACSATNNIPASSQLMFTMSADGNHDGQADLFTVDFDNSSISARFNDNGCFSLENSVSVDPFPRPGALGDVNMDGILDFVSPSQANNTISVRKGLGGGSFGALFTYGTDAGPLCAAIGDANQDGWPDVVTANIGADSISLLFNNGAGAFGAPMNLGTGSQPDYVIFGNFDGDSKLDIAVGLFGSNDMQVFLAIGGGYYYIPAIYSLPANSRCTGLDAGDFDQDGTLDIATANFSSNTITTMPNFGNGAFSLNSMNAGGGPIAVAITDLNGDGYADFATANNASDDLSFFYAPTYVEQRHLAGHSLRNIAVADFNLDGRPDLALACFAGKELSIITNAPKPFGFMNAYGTGTHGCYGRGVLNANDIPKVNNPGFRFTCTGAPRNSLGIGLVADVADFVGTDYFSIGVLMHLDFINLSEFYWFDFYSDNWGVGIGPAAIPNDNSLIGKNYYIQALFAEDVSGGQSCSASFNDLMTTRGIHITIQP
ncbi:MAG: VCBS repeat-containing protein [Planctomycetes bacterium]|nr:VCBS repeat-containing protein [Planctomycetota bacterium]